MKAAPKFPNMRSWFNLNKQKGKQKEDTKRIAEPLPLKLLTTLVTFVAMAIGLSVVSLFSQPLPILLAVLVAFITFREPRFGMPIGTGLIGFGMIYHLADLNFISALGTIAAREYFIIILMTVLVLLPIIFNHYKDALAIDLGILAVALLFFTSTYFLAIPLILTSAVFFKKSVALTAVYYALISAPLQIVQYFGYISTITRPDWWVTPGSAPPLFVPLNSIFHQLTLSMGQFRLYDSSLVVYTITSQVTNTTVPTGRSVKDALSQYLDSFPGIMLFVVIVVGLALALVFLSSTLIKNDSMSDLNRLMPCFIATLAAALFFIFAGALQGALAFTASVSGTSAVLGTLATLVFTLPAAFVSYTPKQTTTPTEITDKIRALLDKLQVLEDQIKNVKTNIPVNVSSPEGKMLITKDSLEDIRRKSDMLYNETSDLTKKLEELKNLDRDIDGLEGELDTILSEYQIFISCEFANWIGKLKDIGLDVKSTVPVDFQRGLTIDARIDAIKQILDGGRILAHDIVQVAEPIYGIIRPLYDPNLPETSRAIEFAQQKLDQKEAPWIAIEALYNALNNWNRQYGAEILASMKYLKSSLTPIAELNSENEVLPPIFGENMPKVLDYAKKAESMKLSLEKFEKDKLNIVDVLALEDNVQSFLLIAKDVLSMLYAEFINEEDSVDRLLPTKDYLWETNSTLRERLKKATETLSNPSNYKLNQIMENLPLYLSYVDEAVQTLAVYNERREFLLNYPMAQAAIEEQLKQKNHISPQDLPFQPKFAGEYLRLYYTQRFSEFSFDKENLQLTKKS